MRSFNPMMILNKSETSATRRLLQCTGFGLYMNDISSKFAPPDDDFASRRAIVHQVAKWCETYTGQNKVEWVPILYLYEVRFSCCADDGPNGLTHRKCYRS